MPRSRSVKQLSSRVESIRRGRRKSYSVPSTGDLPLGRPRSSENRTVPPGARRTSESIRSVPSVRYGCAPHPYGAGLGTDVRRGGRDGQPGVGERVLDAQRERERVARPRMEQMLHHDGVRATSGRRTTPPSGRGRGSRRSPPGRRSATGGAARRTRSSRPRGGWATGSALARGPTGTSRRRRSRRGQRVRRPRTSAALLPPRRRPRVGRRARSRPGRRTVRANRLPQSLEEVVADPEGVGHRREGRIHRADAREDACVDDVQVVELVRLAVHVEH